MPATMIPSRTPKLGNGWRPARLSEGFAQNHRRLSHVRVDSTHFRRFAQSRPPTLPSDRGDWAGGGASGRVAAQGVIVPGGGAVAGDGDAVRQYHGAARSGKAVKLEPRIPEVVADAP